MATHSGCGSTCGIKDERDQPITYRPGASKVRVTTCARLVTDHFRTRDLRDIPRPKVDAIDLLRQGESTSESKKSVEANREGQEASHSGKKGREGLRIVGYKTGGTKGRDWR